MHMYNDKWMRRSIHYTNNSLELWGNWAACNHTAVLLQYLLNILEPLRDMHIKCDISIDSMCYWQLRNSEPKAGFLIS